LHQLCILQFVYPDDSLTKGKHRNLKEGSHNSSFNRSKKSVLAKIKEETTNSLKPTDVYSKAFMECRGVLGVSSCGSVP